MVAKYQALIIAIVAFLFGTGLEMSGYTNLPLAISLWTVAGMLFLWWLWHSLPENPFQRKFMGPLALIVIGVICFVIAGFWYLKTAEHTDSSAPNANFVLLPPNHSYSLDWDPPNNLQIITRPKLAVGENPPSGSRLPCFRLKNIGESVAEDISIEWKTKFTHPLEKLILTSPRLLKFNPSIEKGFITLTINSQTGQNSWSVKYDEIAVSKIPYLAPEINNESDTPICIPSDLWALIEFLIVAILPEQILATSKAELIITVQWNKARPSKQKFLVVVTSRNIKSSGSGKIKVNYGGEWREPPELMTSLSFTVTKLDN